MARGRKAKKDNVVEVGILKLIKFDPSIIEEKRKQNFTLDEFVTTSVDINGNWELFQIKQTTVTEDNIKSTKTTYGDKYVIGDTYQEWISMGKYLNSYEKAVEYYSNLKFNNEVSQLVYCDDVKKLVEIKQRIYDDLNKTMINTIPVVAKQISKATDELYEISKLANEMRLLTTETTNVCNEAISFIKDKRKIVVENMPKQKKHKVVEEVE